LKILFFFEKIYKIYTIIKIFIFLPLIKREMSERQRELKKIYARFTKNITRKIWFRRF